MKKPQQNTPFHQRRSQLALALSISIATASATSLVGEETTQRPLPTRLPAATASLKTDSPAVTAQPVGHKVPAPAQSSSTEPVLPSARWLRSKTSSASAEASRQLIVQGSQEYSVGAWMSAETTAWESLRCAAESVDLAARERGSDRADAIKNLQAAKVAIREARDFAPHRGILNKNEVERIASSHETKVFESDASDGLTATDASDRYLDHARTLLAPLASESVEAARTMDLLAAVYLQRNDEQTLPSATALCLRRAALQGQPTNASLAARLGYHLTDVGLLEEARWALEHSLSIAPDPQAAQTLVQVLRRTGQDQAASHLMATIQSQASLQAAATSIPVPQIEQLTPEEFAAVSKPVMQQAPQQSTTAATPVSAKLNVTRSENQTSPVSPTEDSVVDAEVEVKPGMLRRVMNSFKRIW